MSPTNKFYVFKKKEHELKEEEKVKVAINEVAGESRAYNASVFRPRKILNFILSRRKPFPSKRSISCSAYRYIR